MNEPRISPDVLKRRTADAERALREAGSSALLVYAQGSSLGPAARTHGYMRYLCDWDSHHNPSVLVLRPGMPPVLFVVNVFSQNFAREYFWIKDVRFVKPAELGALAAALCGDASRGSNKVALIGRNEMPAPVWEAVDRVLPGCDWVDFAPELDRARVVKSDEQLLLHRHAAGICDALFA